MDHPRLSRPFILKLTVSIIVLVLLLQYWLLQASWYRDYQNTQSISLHQLAGNATLGFGAILAVTPHSPPERTSWRKAGMQQAASFNGLDIGYPRQPQWNESDTERLAANSPDGEPKGGAAKAWLGHLYTLQQATEHRTALIFEDDVDWDVAIREQSVAVAEAIWDLTHPHDDEQDKVLNEESDAPYGLSWDVLWLGHCGSSLPREDDEAAQITSFTDTTLPPIVKTSIPQLIENPTHQRYVYRTGSPICSFAYAVTQAAARSIVERASAGQAVAFDVWMHFACERGELRCYAVNPELFHQHEMAGPHDSIINGVDQGTVVEARRTMNIRYSARCNADLGGSMEQPVTCSGEPA
ncbi:uncharacterized protein J3D65DRAFT_641406 [Phyllosticta citribraziliensis]|uniref:Glycosyltransferase family 25 protein n=1 Tax=Phyllosticta citribraziliensis TaxID=989973 RepID=A0ABR1L3N1_9PEZI